MKFWIFVLMVLSFRQVSAQSKKIQPADMVNVFIGSSGDRGQMSPAASYPFGFMSIGPQTYPELHMGYEHLAKTFLGFTHNRFEGVGCRGSGGNILIKPFSGKDHQLPLIKATEKAGPGYYQASFANGIRASIAVYKNNGVEEYVFPAGTQQSFYLDLSHTLANRFVAEQHETTSNGISGWVDSRTTCNEGTYRVYYAIRFNRTVKFRSMDEHKLIAEMDGNTSLVKMNIAFSSVDVAHATQDLATAGFEQLKTQSTQGWNNMLGAVRVQGDAERMRLFYSLLYRTIQSPYLISAADGQYRAIDGSLQKRDRPVYNGWSIWDNYRTQLPLLSVLYPEQYNDMAFSIANLYPYGKRNYATAHEPSNTVRTEHAMVVLLDAYRKGYKIDFAPIIDSLLAEGSRLDFGSPDKALESSYDCWALGNILAIAGRAAESKQYLEKAASYKERWNKDFKDITRSDVDRMQARGLYQGTIWQYRWFVPFDVKGLIALTGGEKTYTDQLDQFFDNDLYNHANEPDIQAPLMYNVTAAPWKSQALVHKYAVDTVVQYYFNDNSRGIDPFVDRVYRNQPDGYIRTMDDDAGAMSAWYVFAGCGFFPACVGWPVYYLHVPLFPQLTFNWPGGKRLSIRVENFTMNARYIHKVMLNGQPLTRNWLTHDELMKGGELVISASEQPDEKWGTGDQWIPSIEQTTIK
ncbi:alpha-mannosidase [Chitinophaga sp. SYP-B3965]|uniref:glycoside hydrolase domain-containing protein n=1 Tax=Chitinophaga sp. SYP-B3965 TaxID=2663120 RepID=UPI001299E938|nr:glycoside hydrolase domain-containing protein [Chitinophaga sp. SYP-B3965]MRG48035.1 alpha-mannosidase [Chitinophaga sp. SYP-B3965]